MLLFFYFLQRSEWKHILKSSSTRTIIYGIILMVCIDLLGEFSEEVLKSSTYTAFLVTKLSNTVFHLLGILLYMGFVRAYYWSIQFQKESKEKDAYIKMLKSYYQQIDDNDREIRRIKHDIQSHLDVLGTLFTEENIPAAQQYLKDVQDSYHQIPKLYDVGNDMVNAVINNCCHCHSKNIHLVCKGYIPSQLRLSEFELCTIVSNLLNNSMEACEKNSDSNRNIDLTFGTWKNHFTIHIANPYSDYIDPTASSFTSKEDKKSHGFGLYNVRLIVERYKGNLDIQTDHNVYNVSITIHM